MKPKSFSFQSKDGLSLLGRVWVAQTKKPKGIIHLAHDLGEHSGRYDHLGKAFAEAGYHLAGFDLRGHGLSKGRRGHALSLSQVLDDYQVFIDETSKYLGNNLQKFLYGQGIGGNLVIVYGQQTSNGFNGAIVTSPAFSTTVFITGAKLTLAKLLAKLSPGFRYKYDLQTAALSRNTAIVQAYRQDVYVHNKVSVQLMLDLLESGQQALKNASQWVYPMLLMHGSADRITSYSASQEFAAKTNPVVDYTLWEGYYHELHNDLGSEAVFARMIQWLDQHTQ